jgi:hypothetical protein
MTTLLNIMKNEEPRVVRTWRSPSKHEGLVLMTIPCKLARKYNIKAQTNLLAIDTGEGILFKKLEVPT